MKREEKAKLAGAVINRAADLFEDWEATIREYPELRFVDPEEAKIAVAKWLVPLPGPYWDTILPLPKKE